MAEQAARKIAASGLELYEAAIRALTELEWSVAQRSRYEPLSSLLRAWADGTRDTAAIQLSTARWVLDV